MVFHGLHGHYHWDDVYLVQLLRVGEGGRLEEHGAAFKRTGCMSDYVLGDWQRFDQAPAYSDDASNECDDVPIGDVADPVRETEWIGISPGWAGVYMWSLPDNYVKFDGAEGEYVLRFTVDPHDLALETDETNNVAYARFRVAGGAIEVLERGYGAGPDDPARVPVQGPWIT